MPGIYLVCGRNVTISRFLAQTMSICEYEANSTSGCRRQAHLRRALSENNERICTYVQNSADKNEGMVRSRSISLCVAITVDVTPTVSPGRKVTDRRESNLFKCPVARRADSSGARSTGSLSTNSLNQLDDDDVFGVRGRGSQTSVANVKSREDLVMSDHDGNLPAASRSFKPEVALKVTVESTPKQSDKRAAKARKRRVEKDKAQKDVSSAKASQLDSPGISKSKHKHGKLRHCCVRIALYFARNTV